MDLSPPNRHSSLASVPTALDQPYTRLRGELISRTYDGFSEGKCGLSTPEACDGLKAVKGSQFVCKCGRMKIPLFGKQLAHYQMQLIRWISISTRMGDASMMS